MTQDTVETDALSIVEKMNTVICFDSTGLIHEAKAGDKNPDAWSTRQQRKKTSLSLSLQEL
jgi:hypothetical protein